MGFPQWDGAEVGSYFRHVLSIPSCDAGGKVDVVFCPGMGNGDGHSWQAWQLFKLLGISHNRWENFCSGGQDFCEYKTEARPRTHPDAIPELIPEKMAALKHLLASREPGAPPVILVGFSAGAYLAMTAVRSLRAEGLLPRQKLGLLAFGHTFFPAERFAGTCDVHGAIILGEEEQRPCPWMQSLSGDTAGYCSLDRIPGGVLPDEVGVPTAFSGYAGRPAELHHLSRTFRGCVVLAAQDASHRVQDYTWAARLGKLSPCHTYVPSPPTVRAALPRPSRRRSHSMI